MTLDQLGHLAALVNPDQVPGLAALALAVGTLVWGVRAGKGGLAESSTRTALDLWERVEALEQAMDRERGERRKLADELAEYHRGVVQLVEQLMYHDLKPQWLPPSWPKGATH